jgi:hypothetical protein
MLSQLTTPVCPPASGESKSKSSILLRKRLTQSCYPPPRRTLLASRPCLSCSASESPPFRHGLTSPLIPRSWPLSSPHSAPEPSPTLPLTRAPPLLRPRAPHILPRANFRQGFPSSCLCSSSLSFHLLPKTEARPAHAITPRRDGAAGAISTG